MNHMSSCPGSRMFDFRRSDESQDVASQVPGQVQSQLRQWPVQLHLINPVAPYYQGADVLLTADCVAYALGSFHTDHLKGKAIAIACPKLDDGQEGYVEKIISWLEDAKINTLTVMIMQVPCCGGLLHLAQEAVKQANRKIPIKAIVVGLQGEILREDWV